MLLDILLVGWSVATLRSWLFYFLIAYPCVDLRLHGVLSGDRGRSITLTFLYFWCCEFLQICDAGFQPINWRFLYIYNRISGSILTAWACRVISVTSWTRPNFHTWCSYSGCDTIGNACSLLRIKVGWKAGCVVVLLFAKGLGCWWKILRTVIHVIWIRIVHFLSILNSNYNYKL